MSGLYPEPEDYIYRYCQKFQTKDESMAGRTDLERTSV